MTACGANALDTESVEHTAFDCEQHDHASSVFTCCKNKHTLVGSLKPCVNNGSRRLLILRPPAVCTMISATFYATCLHANEMHDIAETRAKMRCQTGYENTSAAVHTALVDAPKWPKNAFLSAIGSQSQVVYEQQFDHV